MPDIIKNSKIVFDPLWGIIDITDFLPMIDVPEFQALGFKYQLGTTSLLFPSATHTRKQHSLGAFRRTQSLSKRWRNLGLINDNDVLLLQAFALWHDFTQISWPDRVSRIRSFFPDFCTSYISHLRGFVI